MVTQLVRSLVNMVKLKRLQCTHGVDQETGTAGPWDGEPSNDGMMKINEEPPAKDVQNMQYYAQYVPIICRLCKICNMQYMHNIS